jgi:serine/threonine protein kinase
MLASHSTYTFHLHHTIAMLVTRICHTEDTRTHRNQSRLSTKAHAKAARELGKRDQHPESDISSQHRFLGGLLCKCPDPACTDSSQKNDTHIYLVMEYCTGSDLSVYIKNKGRIPTLDYIPRGAPSDADKIFYPHPVSGGIAERVTRCFLGQLGESRTIVASSR